MEIVWKGKNKYGGKRDNIDLDLTISTLVDVIMMIYKARQCKDYAGNTFKHHFFDFRAS